MRGDRNLPDEIRCELLDIHGTRYVLPRRQLGRFRSVGTLVMLFGTAFAVIPAVGLGGHAIEMIRHGKFDVFEFVPALFAIPFVVAGVCLAVIGLLVSRGHAEVETTGDTLVMRERAGLFRWTRKLPVARIKLFKVVHGLQGDGVPSMAALTAKVEGQRDRMIVVGYPEPWLEALANELAGQIATGDEKPEVRVEEARLGDLDEDESADQFDLFEQIDQASQPVPQPDSSRTRVERFEGGGITLNVPGAGLVKGGKGLFLFALFWCGISLAMIGGFLVSAIQSGDFTQLLFVVPIALVFMSVGVAMLLAAINMGTRRVAIAVFDGGLMLMTKGVFGTKKMEWERGDVQSVIVGPSGMAVNEVPVLELQIHALGKKKGLLAGHDDEELYWLADEIMRALHATGGVE